MPQVRHSAQKAECSPCLPSAERHPLHQQDQSSPHLRCSSTQLQPPETLGHCHCYPCLTWSKTAPGWGPDGSTTLAGWHLLFRLTIWAQLRSWEGWWSGAGGQVPLAALTSTVLVAEVGEAPDISQANDLPSHGQDILQLVVPLTTLQGLVLLLFFLLLLFHARVCGHHFTIADSTRDTVIHPTFKKSSLHYIQHKPCKEAEI